MTERQFAHPIGQRRRRVVKVDVPVLIRQSKRMALIETVVSTGVGLCVSLAAQVVLFKAMGLSVSVHQNLTILAVMTLLSIARGYGLRRAFNWWHGR